MTPDRKEHWTVKVARLGLAAAALSSQVGCRHIGKVTPPPEGTSTNPTETVPPVTLPSTEISPSSGVGEAVVIAEQRYMSQQEVLAIDPLVESKFREFQKEIKANNPSATFAAWGALATAQTGETYFTPFFEVYNDGNLVSEYVNIGKIDGSIATLELKPGEVEGPDGKIYVSLSQTVNADTNELLETPLPYIWIPYSRAEYYALSDDEKAKVPVYFSAIPGIVPQNEASVYGGAKTTNIRMIIATPTPEVPLPQEFLDKLPEGYKVTNGQLLNESGVALGTIKVGQSGEGYNLAFTAPDISDTLQNYEADLSSFMIHPSGALLINSGERVGFVWKGDKWAEILLDIEFQTNETELNNLPEITLEDITSGRLAEAERLASQPFPEGVEPLNNYYYDLNISGVYPDIGGEIGYEFSLHPEKFPMRFVYFYQAEINNIPVVAATLQVLNKDKTSVFIHIVESRKYINSYPDYWNKVIQLRYVPGFDMALGGDKYDACKNGWSEAITQVVCPLNAPQKDRLQATMRELVEQQRIPEEFERILFVPNPGRWY